MAGAKASDDEDEEEDDDDASSCSSGPAHDTDEHDPDLSFAEVSKVITNLDLGADPAKSKSHKKKEAPQQASVPPPPPVQVFVKPGPPIPQRILDDLDMCTAEDFSYSFSRKTLANGRVWQNFLARLYSQLSLIYRMCSFLVLLCFKILFRDVGSSCNTYCDT